MKSIIIFLYDYVVGSLKFNITLWTEFNKYGNYVVCPIEIVFEFEWKKQYIVGNNQLIVRTQVHRQANCQSFGLFTVAIYWAKFVNICWMRSFRAQHSIDDLL